MKTRFDAIITGPLPITKQNNDLINLVEDCQMAQNYISIWDHKTNQELFVGTKEELNKLYLETLLEV
jgi:hypothetical protein